LILELIFFQGNLTPLFRQADLSLEDILQSRYKKVSLVQKIL